MFCQTVDREITICLPEERHAHRLFALVDANRDYLRHWLPWLDANHTVDQSRQFITTNLENFARKRGFAVMIFYNDQPVGVSGYNHLDWQNASASIGYWLAEDFQGRGIITRTCRHLIEFAFNQLGMHRVEIRCAAKNHASRAIPRRLGFTEEGTVRHAEWLYDHFVDHVIYGMLAAEWRKARQS
ncbi:MAG: N-acetyltransferase [Chloroflexi bacterium]|nr:MAG: N-acetyltransferase [Chloroflexota bacterium]